MDRQAIRVGIIGGGPAGLMSALLLARKGCEITLVERGTWPLDKVCGEGIMPLGVEILRRHGLLARIDPAWTRPFRGIRYVGSDGRQASGEFKGEAGLAVRRLALSKGLFGAVLEEPRIVLLSSTALHGFEETAAGVALDVRDMHTGEHRSLGDFDYLIGADGLKSKVRRLAALDGRVPGCQPNRMGARVHYRMRPWDDKVQVWWKAGIEAYVTPTSSDCVDISFGWDQDQLQPKQALPGACLEAGLLSFFPELKQHVDGRETLSSLRSWGPLPHCAKTPLKGRVALIGDAGLFYDQITGEGLSLAFAQAEILAEWLPKWDSHVGRERFRSSIRSLAKHYIKVTNIAMFFTRHVHLRALMIRLLAKSPSLFSHLLHANMGDRALWRLPLPSMLRDFVTGQAGRAARYAIPKPIAKSKREHAARERDIVTSP